MAVNGKGNDRQTPDSSRNQDFSNIPAVPQRIMSLLRSSNLSNEHIEEIELGILGLMEGRTSGETYLNDNEVQAGSATTAEGSSAVKKRAHRGKRSGRQAKEKEQQRKNEVLSIDSADVQAEPTNDDVNAEIEKPKATRGQRGGQQKTEKIERWKEERQAKKDRSDAASHAQV